MKYVDGFVFVVEKKNLAAYKKMAQQGAKMWKKHGALEYMECRGDDVNPDTHGMKMITFPRLTNLKKNETVWFSFITYKSKAHRNAVNKKVMKEMSEKMKGHENDPMPFDMKRMSFGGFNVIVDA